MREIRPPKDDDNEKTEKGFLLIMKLIKNHPEIELTLWGGAFWGVLVNGYRNCGFTHEEFSEECKKVLAHYKDRW